MLCCSNFKTMSPPMFIAVAALVSIGLGCNMDSKEKELIGNLLLAIGQLIILMGIQQENLLSRTLATNNCYNMNNY